MTDLASTIRTARLAAPMSQEQLAGAAGLSRKTVSRVEGGEPPSAETLLALCSVLRLDASTVAPNIAAPARAAAPGPEELAAMATWPHDTPERKALVADMARAAYVEVPGAVAMVTPDVGAYREQVDAMLAGYYPAGGPPGRPDEFLRRRAARLKLVQTAGWVIPLAVTAYHATATYYDLTPMPGTLATPHLTPMETLRGILGLLAIPVVGAFYVVGLVMLGCIAEKPLWEIRDRNTVRAAMSLLEGRAYVMGSGGLHVMTRVGQTVEIVHVPPTRVNSFIRGPREGCVTYILNMADRDVPVEPSPVEYLANRLQPRNDVFELPFVQSSDPFDAGMALYRDRSWSPTARYRLTENHALPKAA